MVESKKKKCPPELQRALSLEGSWHRGFTAKVHLACQSKYAFFKNPEKGHGLKFIRENSNTKANQVSLKTFFFSSSCDIYKLHKWLLILLVYNAA